MLTLKRHSAQKLLNHQKLLSHPINQTTDRNQPDQ